MQRGSGEANVLDRLEFSRSGNPCPVFYTLLKLFCLANRAWENRAVPAAGCCRGQGGNGSEEKRCGDRKSEDDGASSGTGYCRVGVCYGGISTLLRLRSRDA